MENSVDLEIIFDFNKQNVVGMDSTASSGDTGRTYNNRGLILMAVANHKENFFKIIGTLAHELTHYAMQLIYENNCNPYGPNEKETRAKLDAIEENLIELYEHDTIIGNVFKFYKDRDVWHAEIIVRVLHLVARYRNNREQLKKIEESYEKDLFDFYREIKVQRL